MKKKSVILMFATSILSGVLFLSSCTNEDMSGTQSNSTTSLTSRLTVDRSSGKGITSAIPAYYDGNLFKIIFVAFPLNSSASLIANNTSINLIYQSDPGLPDNQPFISVIDAIPGEGKGFNPIWREVQIIFNSGFIPHQLFNDDEILAAASGSNPEITLITTDEIYKCPVIGTTGK